MRRFNSFAWLAGILFAAGCAGSPELANQSMIGDGAAPVGAPAALAADPGAAAGAQAVAPKVVDVRDFPPNANAAICRDMLKPLSNVIVTYCLTPDDWKEYERQEALAAERIVRMFQGSSYR